MPLNVTENDWALIINKEVKIKKIHDEDRQPVRLSLYIGERLARRRPAGQVVFIQYLSD